MFKRLVLVLTSAAAYSLAADSTAIAPTQMTKIGTVDTRFQSFNVEMVEVTGGRFWAPYKAKGPDEAKAPSSELSTPGVSPSAFRYRPPIDLSNARLRKLAAALGPLYIRVSGTWANSTYFDDSTGDAQKPATPPKGFGGVLTQAEWRGVSDFAKAVNAKIVTSFTISDGVRDANGVWTPDQAAKFLAHSKSIGAPIAAAEFFNEPSFASMGGAPKGYNAASYGRDFKVFLPFIKKAAPEILVLGPGSVGEGTSLAGGASGLQVLKSEDMLTQTGPGVDAFSYHFYGGVSKRCSALANAPAAAPERGLTEEWLSGSEKNEEFYAKLRDRFEPGKAIWLTETGETACGGNPWASTFADSFRYLNQMGSLAKKGVQVIAHNTLAASDYALIDEDTLEPRPNYWAALLWHKLMGTTVLDAGASTPGVHVYAHCLPGHAGGVAVLAINTSSTAAAELSAPKPSERYSLTAKELAANTVELNGHELKLGSADAMPAMKPVKEKAGKVTLAPTSITFLAFPKAANAACRQVN